jgi:hypothetical protein
MSDQDYTAILLEEIRDQNKAVLEAVADLPTRREFEELREDVTELKQDVKVVKAAVTDLSHKTTWNDVLSGLRQLSCPCMVPQYSLLWR